LVIGDFKMNIKLNNSDSIDLDKLISTRLLIQANSGGGKSWLIRRLLEQSHGKVQQIVIDLEGEFSSLREKFDYIVAGKGGDTPAEPRSAALLARKLLELNVSAIIDLYELNSYDRKYFVKLFLEALVDSPKELWHQVLVVVDEAHVFCPEKGQSEAMATPKIPATSGTAMLRYFPSCIISKKCRPCDENRCRVSSMDVSSTTVPCRYRVS